MGNNGNRSGDRSALARFGQGRTWKLGDIQLDVGEVIASAGPGKGFAMVPWTLDTYERALRLKPAETWLLKRMLQHAWEADTPVYLSQKKIAREAIVSRTSVRRTMNRLEELGYITRLEGRDGDPRRYYSVRGLYDALALCIAADPTSTWAKQNGDLLTPTNTFRNGAGVCFQIDWGALPAVRRNSHNEYEKSDTMPLKHEKKQPVTV
jgi:biotin operon repressor